MQDLKANNARCKSTSTPRKETIEAVKAQKMRLNKTSYISTEHTQSTTPKQQGEVCRKLFPPLDKQQGWPSPQARANTSKQQGDNSNTPHGEQTNSLSNPVRADGKIQKQTSSSLCTCPGCPRQHATGLQLAHTVNNKH